MDTHETENRHTSNTISEMRKDVVKNDDEMQIQGKLRCSAEISALLSCVSGENYANISSCKEQMRALRECCVQNNIKNFHVVKECTNSRNEDNDGTKKDEKQ